MASRKFILISILVLFLGAILLLVSGVYYIRSSSSIDTETVVNISKGAGLRDIANTLQYKGVIKSEKLFVLYVLWSGDQDKLKAGEYEFNPGDTMRDVLQKLVDGQIVLRKVTIPEGLNLREIAVLLDEKNVFDSVEFMSALGDGDLRAELLGPGAESFEGYLFPETYSYTFDITPAEFVRMMVDRFNAVYGSLDIDSSKIDLTRDEILTLASIVEEETGDASERPLVAAVFLNRLRKGMRLESDPTVIYGLGSAYNGNLTKTHLRTPTDYNTYVHGGLPPGPISNPGKHSIEAVLNPAQVKYIYFVAKGDGTHVFSTNYRDHSRAVRKYQRRRGGGD